MAGVKADVVVEAVHYNQEGKVDWVRVYERIGNAYTDRLIWKRDMLVSRLKKGAKVYAGKRILLLAGSFELGDPIQLVEKDGENYLVTGSDGSDKDSLQTVPIL